MTQRLTYFSRNGSSHVGTLGNNNIDLERSPATSSGSSAGASANWYLYSPSSDPNLSDWPGGTYTWFLNITTANSNFRLDTVTVHRLNSARTSSLASKSVTGINQTLSTVQTYSGTITWNDGTQNPGGRAASDTFALQIQITKTGGHGGDAITIQLAGPNDTRVITPLDVSTTLYFHAATDSTSGLPTTEQSALTVEDNVDAQTVNRSMTETIGTSQTSLAYANITGSPVDGRDVYYTKFVSPPLDMTSISATTWIYNFAASQNHVDADFPCNELSEGFNRIYAVLYVWRPSTTTKIGTIFDSNCQPNVGYDGNPNTNENVFNMTFAGSSVASMSTDDVLIFEIWHEVDSASGTRTGTVFYDGTTENFSHIVTVSNHASLIEPNGIELIFAAGGPQTFQRTPSDTVNLSEALERLVTFQRTPTEETTSLSDTVEPHAIRPRSIQDTTNLSDTVQRLYTALRSPQETVNLSDTVQRIFTALRTAQDTTAINETLETFKVIVRTAQDTVTSADQVAITIVRTLADTTTSSDNLQRLATFIRNSQDTITITDLVDAARLFLIQVADTVTQSETLQRLASFIRNVQDSTTLSESAVKTKIAVRAPSDTTTLSESINRIFTAVRTLQDTTTISESVSRLATFIRNLLDSSGISDAVQAFKNPGTGTTFTRNVSDTINLTENLVRTLTSVRSLQDTVILSETVQRVLSALRNVQDSIILNDTVQSFKVFVRSVADTTNLSENVQRLYTALRTPQDTVIANENLQTIRTFIKQVQDSVTTADTIQKFFIQVRTVQDTVSSSDTVNRLASFVRAATEISNISDTLQAIFTPLVPPTIPRIFRRISLRKVKGSERKVKGSGRKVKGSNRTTKGSGRKVKGSDKQVSSEEDA